MVTQCRKTASVRSILRVGWEGLPRDVHLVLVLEDVLHTS
jgi:hypothetical protein